jgi:inner membrane protein
METIEKIRTSLFQSLGLKLALIAILSLVLLIPSAFIMELIREREQRMNETVTDVTSGWGVSQTLTGPILAVQLKTTVKEKSAEVQNTPRIAYFLPEKLLVTGEVKPEVRYRGIYKVVTYHALLHASGNFPVPLLPLLQLEDPATTGRRAWIELGISDMRGINKAVELKTGDTLMTAQPGIPGTQVSASGVHVNLDAIPSQGFDFAFDLDLNGSENLKFIPVGKQTHVELASSWKAPSFSGAFLPDSREVTPSGFKAVWDILELNRNYPQQWVDNQYNVAESAFGVDLLTLTDNYQKATRSAKYAILFIALTFLIFFFAEVMTGVRIHPFYYILVGIALSVFYSLLTAVSEYLPFGISYILSAAVIITMISLFTQSLYKKVRVTLTVTLSLVLLYIFLYVILQLTDYSLLVGNIGLVVILGIVMYFSRKIDWYGNHAVSE